VHQRTVIYPIVLYCILQFTVRCIERYSEYVYNYILQNNLMLQLMHQVLLYPDLREGHC